jgi:SAM-dependent methyltransferase
MLRSLKKLFKKPVAVRASWVETPSKFSDLTKFLDWFDKAASVQDALQRAEADWKFRFGEHSEYQAIEKRCALEIGFGGGRLVLQACKDFALVVGVDIHSAFDKTERFLHEQQCKNFKLLHRDQIGSVSDKSVDFVYSFIVFQHFDSMDEVRFYLGQIGRVLKPAGYAHIYFGRNEGKGVKIVTEEQFKLRDRSLFVEPRLMTEEIGKSFQILDVQDHLPKDPISKQGRSGQFFVKFKRQR